MLHKKTILIHNEDFNSVSNFYQPVWKEYFNVEVLDDTKTYDKNSCVLITNYLNTTNWYVPWVKQGYRLIIDHLWDNDTTAVSYEKDNILTLQAKNWAWINEALWYFNLGYDRLEFNNDPDKFFLMPMRLQKLHRDMIYNLTKSYLNDSLYSYVSKNIFLANDIDQQEDMHQRHVEPLWYNTTHFSLVAESFITSPAFLSEKTFKPIAFKHPFVIWGSQHTLKYLHDNKFETFNHIIDESYDNIVDHRSRLSAIIEVVDKLYTQYKDNQPLFTDAITKEKILHNYHRFYNYELVKSMFFQEVISPVLEFV